MKLSLKLVAYFFLLYLLFDIYISFSSVFLELVAVLCLAISIDAISSFKIGESNG